MEGALVQVASGCQQAKDHTPSLPPRQRCRTSIPEESLPQAYGRIAFGLLGPRVQRISFDAVSHCQDVPKGNMVNRLVFISGVWPPRGTANWIAKVDIVE